MDSQIAAIAIAFITGVAGPILVMWSKKKIEKASDVIDPLIKAVEVNSIIDTEIDNLLFEIECDRVWMLQFHNGGHFYPTGKSIQKFSIFYESAADGIARITQQYQNIPVSLFSKSFKEITSKGELIISDIDSEFPGLQTIAISTGCRAIMLVAIKSKDDDKVVAVLGIDYNEVHLFTETEKSAIRETAALLSGVLMQFLKSH